MIRTVFQPRSTKRYFQLIFTVCLALIMAGCGEQEAPKEKNVRRGNGDIIYGGLLKMNITNETRSIFPHNMIDASATYLMSQVYEGLVTLDPETGKVKMGLAESYTESEDGKRFTFQLRKGIFFHDDQVFNDGIGREVKAEDVVFCLKKLCEPSLYNQHYPLVIDLIKGARAFYEGEGDPLIPIGISVVDEYTLEIELEHMSPTFMSILTHPGCWIFPKELYSYNSQLDSWCVGTGPFVPRTVKMNEVVILERNKKYWRKDELGNSLPYIDAVRCNFIFDEEKQLNFFMEDNLDLLLSVPLSKVSLLEEGISKNSEADYRIISVPGLRVEYYGFQHRDDYFKDVRIRKALYQAIDREFLVDSILLGYGEPADFGFIPPSMPGYNADSVVALPFDPKASQALLAEAGYPGGNGFPVLTLQLNDGGKTILNVAEAVQAMLIKNLGLTIELSVLPKHSHYETVEQGSVAFWRDSWIADYPDPENFLQLFHGALVPEDNEKASYLNTVRFRDEKFDAFFEQSLGERNTDVRMNKTRRADQIIVDHAAVVPLYYENWIWLVKTDVQNLEVSALGNLDLSRVHFSAPKLGK